MKALVIMALLLLIVMDSRIRGKDKINGKIDLEPHNPVHSPDGNGILFLFAKKKKKI